MRVLAEPVVLRDRHFAAAHHAVDNRAAGVEVGHSWLWLLWRSKANARGAIRSVCFSGACGGTPRYTRTSMRGRRRAGGASMRMRGGARPEAVWGYSSADHCDCQKRTGARACHTRFPRSPPAAMPRNSKADRPVGHAATEPGAAVGACRSDRFRLVDPHEARPERRAPAREQRARESRVPPRQARAPSEPRRSRRSELPRERSVGDGRVGGVERPERHSPSPAQRSPPARPPASEPSRAEPSRSTSAAPAGSATAHSPFRP